MPLHNLPADMQGLYSTDNSTSTPLSGSGTFTGTAQVATEGVLVMSYADVAGTLYFDFSIDGTNWDSTYPSGGYRCAAGIPEVHTAICGGRYFRVRYVNDSGAQSTFRLGTYTGQFPQLQAALNQSAGLDSDATLSRPNSFQDEVVIGRRSGVSAWNKFGYRTNLTAAGGDEMIESGGTITTPTILTSASTFTITYDGTGGGSTDGNGTTGATQLTFYYLDSNGEPAVAAHNLGTDGSDETSFSGLGINRIAVSATGSNDVNASAITITATTGGSVQAYIPAGQGVTQQLLFHVPTNGKAIAKFLFLAANKLSGSNPKVLFKGWVYNRSVDSRFEIFRHTMDTQSDNRLVIEDPIGFALSAGDVLYFTADTDQNNTVVEGRFSLNVYLNA